MYRCVPYGGDAVLDSFCSCGFELVTRGYKLVTREFELVSREFELVDLNF